MTNKMKLIKKFLILMILCMGIGYVVFSTNTQTVSARRCCETCPGGGELQDAEVYCPTICYGDESCVQQCVQDMNTCYTYCMWCNQDPESPEIERRFCCEVVGTQNPSVSCYIGYCGLYHH